MAILIPSAGPRRSDSRGAHLAVTALVVGALLASCGDGLTVGGYRGEPLYAFEGLVSSLNEPTRFEHPLRASAFWSPNGQTDVDRALLVEQSAISVEVEFPGTFRINVFEPPTAVEWTQADALYRVALVLIYEDVNEDARFQPDELRGGAFNQALLYAPALIPAAQSPVGQSLAPGYHAVLLPMPCGLRTISSGTDACGERLGEGCAADDDCDDGGRCLLTDYIDDWPGGYCMIRFEPDGCQPQEGVLVADPDFDPFEDANLEVEPDLYWFLGCKSSADCRADEGYKCVDGFCQPGLPAALVIDSNLEIEPLCAVETPPDNWEPLICASTLGAACETDEDCGNGRACLTTLDLYDGSFNLPGGMCTSEAMFGCIEDPEETDPLCLRAVLGAEIGVQFASCVTAPECGNRLGYDCIDWLDGLCMPSRLASHLGFSDDAWCR